MQVRSHRVRRTATKVTAVVATIALASLAVVDQPASAEGKPFGFAEGAFAGLQVGVDPRICNPVPPDYPGCTAAQARPDTQYQVRRQYTGHAAGYRFYNWGQHHRGEVFGLGGGLTPGQNTHLRNLYYKAKAVWQRQHAFVGKDGVTVLPQPMYPTWLGFRDNVSAGCTTRWHMPNLFCQTTTEFDWFGEKTWDLTKLVFQCNGTLVGGLFAGQITAKAGWLKLGVGTLKGGWYGIAAGEIGCQVSSLTDWMQHHWGLSKRFR